MHLASLCSGCAAGIPSSLVPFVFVVSAGVALELELDDEEGEGAFLFAVFGRCFVGVALDFGVVCCGFRGLAAPVLRVPEVLACTLASAVLFGLAEVVVCPRSRCLVKFSRMPLVFSLGRVSVAVSLRSFLAAPPWAELP